MSVAAPMTCAEVAERLWEYLDGQLDARTTARVWDHLRQCEACFPEYDFRRAFQTLLRRHADTPVPAGLRARVFRALLAEGFDGDGGSGPLDPEGDGV